MAPGKVVHMKDLHPEAVRPEDEVRLAREGFRDFTTCHLCDHKYNAARTQCPACGTKKKPDVSWAATHCRLCKRPVRSDTRCTTCLEPVHENCHAMHRAIAHGESL
jgi:hypothetical protein